MILKILTPESSVSYDGVASVFLPGTLGQFEVLPSHAPIISSLEKGEIRWSDAEGSHSKGVSTGFATVKDDVITICVE